MCKTKTSTHVVTPKPRKYLRRPSNSFSNSNSNSNSSSTNFTTTDYTATFSSKSSIASRTSLSSLRDSLPENPHIYHFSEICSATNNFLSKKFSSSSSSASWRSTIRGRDVVIFQRKLRRSLELHQLCERLSIICRSHHSSIIKLLGASVSGNYIYLVYEYVSGSNLANCLRNEKNRSFTILSTWLSRMQIATDLAHGLDYIHNFSALNSNVIHNHIKSTSIIVTEQESEPICAKFCHFGTAELCGEVGESKDGKVKKIEGTRGYMSPEFLVSGIATQKTDVYAFGVVILELLSGEEALRFVFDEGSGAYKRISVIENATQVIAGGGGGLRRWVDRRLKDSYPVDVAEKMVVLGLQCVDENPEKMPDMRQVAGFVSRFYLESKTWAEKFGLPTDFSVSLAPR
ncbi:hypothetical protein JRO89_XS14G0031400 [Xanthoceras sorbifolium]|uniref:Protein kinase domain-containing protein n=1 Tax=Xanthoceras sorbifolium TaxID=99658 RepID=A0ABQ8H3I9_9ROSI|nr:hypothetical protein JRO89_XS14G0031400 [Xanthoceras sorbifolium]